MDNMADKLKTMLEDPETLNMLSSLLGSMQSQSAETVQEEEPVPQTSTEQTDNIFKIKQMLEQTSVANDPRINLLNSLKPYMGKKRMAKMDQAIRLIQISKMASIFKP
ncbi:MAG: hypothetical protein IJN62_05980 [Clostridia bacterium]|nr:hypothetical protein [Clostridia bacterium]